ALANIFTSILVTLAVAGGTAAGLYKPAEPAMVENEEVTEPGGSYLELDLIAVPYVANNEIRGYLVSRFTVNFSPDAVANYGDEFFPRVNDVINRELFVRLAALRKTKPYEVHEVIAASLMQEINADFGAEIVHGVFVNQLEFLDKQSVRTPREKANAGG
ncbi:MAG: hypothetical protein AAGF54_20130, partial [Pseudomonadota bacterium]